MHQTVALWFLFFLSHVSMEIHLIQKIIQVCHPSCAVRYEHVYLPPHIKLVIVSMPVEATCNMHIKQQMPACTTYDMDCLYTCTRMLYMAHMWHASKMCACHRNNCAAYHFMMCTHHQNHNRCNTPSQNMLSIKTVL